MGVLAVLIPLVLALLAAPVALLAGALKPAYAAPAGTTFAALAALATLWGWLSGGGTYPVLLDISEAAKLAEDAALPLPAALRRHELSLEGRARVLENELGHSLRIRVRDGEAASVILEAAEEGREPSLVAVGRRGLGKINRLRLGSVSADVLRSATEPVLIVPAPDGA